MCPAQTSHLLSASKQLKHTLILYTTCYFTLYLIIICPFFSNISYLTLFQSSEAEIVGDTVAPALQFRASAMLFILNVGNE